MTMFLTGSAYYLDVITIIVVYLENLTQLKSF